MTTEKAIRDFAFRQWGDKNTEQIALKLAEEAGEVAGAAIKINEGRATEADLEDEIGDVLIVLCQFAAERNTTLDQLCARRFEKIRDRVAKA